MLDAACRRASPYRDCNSYLLQRTRQTGISDVEIKVLKVKGITAAREYISTTR
ncbi:MAG: hypothetical protein ACTS7E_01050 [Arsenophonus sp. NC-CH8-MAG3]